MNQEFVKQIVASGAESLTKLAQVAGSTAIHLYSIIVKQQIIEGAINIFQIILFFVIVIYPLKRLYRFIKDYQEDENIGHGWNWAIAGLGALILVIGTANVVGLLGEAINKIANPEFYALKLILQTVKQ